jgi:predicted SprT family Zn-dependent metalloprotease
VIVFLWRCTFCGALYDKDERTQHPEHGPFYLCGMCERPLEPLGELDVEE